MHFLTAIFFAKPSYILFQKGKVKPVHVVDVPGHARLKPKLDEVLPKAAGVVFVVDAQDFLSSMQAAAE